MPVTSKLQLPYPSPIERVSAAPDHFRALAERVETVLTGNQAATIQAAAEAANAELRRDPTEVDLSTELANGSGGCTLDDNGYFKLYAHGRITTVVFSQLRCPVTSRSTQVLAGNGRLGIPDQYAPLGHMNRFMVYGGSGITNILDFYPGGSCYLVSSKNSGEVVLTGSCTWINARG